MEPSELLLNTSDITPAEINNSDVCHSGVEDTLETEAELDDQSDRQTNLGDNKTLEQQKEEVACSSAVLERVVAVIKHLAEWILLMPGRGRKMGTGNVGTGKGNAGTRDGDVRWGRGMGTRISGLLKN